MHKLVIVEDDEDDEDDVYFLKKVLDDFDYNIELVHLCNGKELLDYVDRHDEIVASLVLLDLNMPVLDGRSVLEALKGQKQKGHWPVVVYTTSERDEDINEAYRLGAHSYVVKSNTFSELKVKMQLILAYWLDVVKHPNIRNGNR